MSRTILTVARYKRCVDGFVHVALEGARRKSTLGLAVARRGLWVGSLRPLRD